MSADAWIETPACKCCGRSPEYGSEVNITYNLSGMLREAGFVGWHDLVGMRARKAGRHILEVLNGMAEDAPKWRAMNPPNGWGDYDTCLQERLRAFAVQCIHAPKGSKIGGSL